jgi:hypothetical protein
MAENWMDGGSLWNINTIPAFDQTSLRPVMIPHCYSATEPSLAGHYRVACFYFETWLIPGHD